MRELRKCSLIAFIIFCLFIISTSSIIPLLRKTSNNWRTRRPLPELRSHLKKIHTRNLTTSPPQILRDYDETSIDDNSVYANLFAIYIDQKSDVDHVKKSGLVFVRKVFEDEDIYLFRYPTTSEFNKTTKICIPTEISLEKKVQWIIRQRVLDRHPRSFHLEKDPNKSNDRKQSYLRSHTQHKSFPNIREFPNVMRFNDPLFGDQWYLHGSSTSSDYDHDVNVLPVWNAGITGKGIRISVLDDGVSPKNPEVTNNYDPRISRNFFDFQTADEEAITENSHGTYCAAIVAGVANNNYCGVGVAYEASIGGARVLHGKITDAQEALGLTHALNYVDIYTASWGPKDDGLHVAGPGFLTRKALLKGVTKGRGGKGSIYVWASGNGGRQFDNCNLDGYASSPFTLTFGALTEKGESTYYSEPCASVIASTYVGGLHFPPTERNLDSYRKMIKVVVPETCGKCRENFQGTSAAAPIAAGIIALILQSNPDLTWRDIQHLIINTAKIPSISEGGWSMNANGKHFHPKIGFGVLDATLAVWAAQTWTPTKSLNKFFSAVYNGKKYIKRRSETMITIPIEEFQKVNTLETVVATTNIVHPRCGNLEIEIHSPSGTVSKVLTPRPLDNKTKKFPMWEFTSLHFWGENPIGLWKLRIQDHSEDTLDIGYINFLKFTFYGTFLNALPEITTKPLSNLSETQLKQILEEERLASTAAVVNLMAAS